MLIIKYFLLLAGLFLFAAGVRHYSISQFFGIHQIRTGHLDHTLSADNAFDTTSILAVIRHPWYTGGIMVMWASDIYLLSLLNDTILSIYFVIGTLLEERKLLLEFGDTYREYQKNVSMLIPYKWLKFKIARLFQI